MPATPEAQLTTLPVPLLHLHLHRITAIIITSISSMHWRQLDMRQSVSLLNV